MSWTNKNTLFRLVDLKGKPGSSSFILTTKVSVPVWITPFLETWVHFVVTSWPGSFCILVESKGNRKSDYSLRYLLDPLFFLNTITDVSSTTWPGNVYFPETEGPASGVSVLWPTREDRHPSYTSLGGWHTVVILTPLSVQRPSRETTATVSITQLVVSSTAVDLGTTTIERFVEDYLTETTTSGLYPLLDPQGRVRVRTWVVGRLPEGVNFVFTSITVVPFTLRVHLTVRPTHKGATSTLRLWSISVSRAWNDHGEMWGVTRRRGSICPRAPTVHVRVAPGSNTLQIDGFVQVPLSSSQQSLLLFWLSGYGKLDSLYFEGLTWKCIFLLFLRSFKVYFYVTRQPVLRCIKLKSWVRYLLIKISW